MLYQDIPRIYTALSECGACLVYLYMLKREKMKSAHFLIGVLLMLALQCAFLAATGNVSEVLWIPCMIIAVAIISVKRFHIFLDNFFTIFFCFTCS